MSAKHTPGPWFTFLFGFCKKTKTPAEAAAAEVINRLLRQNERLEEGIEDTERQIKRVEKQRDELLAALQSIAANTCCERCQEAALVARVAIAKAEGRS